MQSIIFFIVLRINRAMIQVIKCWGMASYCSCSCTTTWWVFSCALSSGKKWWDTHLVMYEHEDIDMCDQLFLFICNALTVFIFKGFRGQGFQPFSCSFSFIANASIALNIQGTKSASVSSHYSCSCTATKQDGHRSSNTSWKCIMCISIWNDNPLSFSTSIIFLKEGRWT